ncbi:hypothetical protein B0E44_12120 [Flavobacterium sp. A45]|nr:hypothetical protein B0E44_12120 [Flavobacterium sp. A45]
MISIKNGTRLVFFGAERLGFFRKYCSRFPLQSCKLNPSLQGFSLHTSDSELAKQSGLKGGIWLKRKREQ